MDFNNCTNITNISFSVEEYLQGLQEDANFIMIPAVICLCLFIVIGLFGNSLILFIYSKKLKHKPTTILLMFIASFDLVANVGAIPSEMVTMFQYWNFNNPTLCKSKVFLNVFTTVGGAITLLVLAVVRYRKVCARQGWQITNKHAKISGACIAFIALLFCIPYIILYGQTSKSAPCYKIKGFECYIDDVYRGTIWPLLNNALFILLYLFLVVPLTVLYTLVGITTRKHIKRINEKKRGQRNVELSATSKSSLNRELIDSQNSSSQFQYGSHLKIDYATSDDESYTNYLGNETENESTICVNNSSVIHTENKEGMVDTHGQVNAESTTNKQENTVIKTTADVFHPRSEMNKTQFLTPTLFSGNPSQTKRDKNITNLDIKTLASSNEMDQNNFIDAKGDSVSKTEVCLNTEKSTENQEPKQKSVANYVRRKKIPVIKLKKTKEARSNKDQISRRSLSRIPAMLVAISAVYVFGCLPFLSLTLYKNVFPAKYASLNNVELSVFHLFLRLYYLNCAANPIIYLFCDLNFRHECLKLLRCQHKRRIK